MKSKINCAPEIAQYDTRLITINKDSSEASFHNRDKLNKHLIYDMDK